MDIRIEGKLNEKQSRALERATRHAGHHRDLTASRWLWDLLCAILDDLEERGHNAVTGIETTHKQEIPDA